jgi:hypothetical protein
MKTHNNNPLSEDGPYYQRALDIVTRKGIVHATARDAHNMIAALTEEFALDEFNADME